MVEQTKGVREKPFVYDNQHHYMMVAACWVNNLGVGEGTLGGFLGWGCAAWTRKPLLYTKQVQLHLATLYILD